MPGNVTPNCAYVHEQANRINNLEISMSEAQLAEDVEDQAHLRGELIPDHTNNLAEQILRQAFITEDQPSRSDIIANLFASVQFRFDDVDDKVLSLSISSQRQVLTMAYALRTEIETKIDKHVRLWHRSDRNRCYRAGDDDSLPVRLFAVIRQAGDILLRKTE